MIIEAPLVILGGGSPPDERWTRLKRVACDSPPAVCAHVWAAPNDQVVQPADGRGAMRRALRRSLAHASAHACVRSDHGAAERSSGAYLGAALGQKHAASGLNRGFDLLHEHAVQQRDDSCSHVTIWSRAEVIA
jgi:hypothetical protein